MGREVADFAVIDRYQKQVGPFVAGEVVPMAVEEMSEDLRLDLAVGQGFVAVGVAGVAGGKVGVGDGGAVRVDKRGEDDGVPVGETILRYRLRLRSM